MRIVRILAKHDAAFPLQKHSIAPISVFLFRIFSKKNDKLTEGARLANALEELGPIFVKFGQTLSARPDIVGNEIAESLARLQDDLPPFSSEKAIKIIEKETGKKIEDLFSSFNHEPFAAASIAQVHKAVTKSGNVVAVKILRPDIEFLFERDMNLINWLSQKADKKNKFKRFKLKEIARLLGEIIKFEMDLRLEGGACSEMQDNFRKDNSIFIPNVHWQLTTKKILTTDWIEGINIDEVEILKQKGHDLEQISRNFAIFFFNQAYGDGFFHADLHPGNILINEKGQISVIDFGIMGRMTDETRLYVTGILQGFMRRDYKKVAQIHFDAGYVKKDKSFGMFSQAIRAVGEPIVGKSLKQISVGKLLSQLFELTKDFDMEIQPQLLLLQKTTILVEGIGAKLWPDVNMWELAEPWIEDWAMKNVSVEAKFKKAAKEFIEKIIGKIE